MLQEYQTNLPRLIGFRLTTVSLQIDSLGDAFPSEYVMAPRALSVNPRCRSGPRKSAKRIFPSERPPRIFWKSDLSRFIRNLCYLPKRRVFLAHHPMFIPAPKATA